MSPQETGRRLRDGTWAALILDADDVPVGAGVLLPGGLVVTCAHVVEAAGGHPERREPVRLRFAFSHQGVRAATVLPNGWFPETDDRRGDIAVLAVADVPPDVEPARVARWEGRSSVRMRAYGQPHYATEPLWATCAPVALAGPGGEWTQLHGEDSGGVIAPGYSGAGVADMETGAVRGIVVSVFDTPTRQANPRVSWMIPFEVIETYWPPLSRHLTRDGHRSRSARLDDAERAALRRLAELVARERGGRLHAAMVEGSPEFFGHLDLGVPEDLVSLVVDHPEVLADLARLDGGDELRAAVDRCRSVAGKLASLPLRPLERRDVLVLLEARSTDELMAAAQYALDDVLPGEWLSTDELIRVVEEAPGAAYPAVLKFVDYLAHQHDDINQSLHTVLRTVTRRMKLPAPSRHFLCPDALKATVSAECFVLVMLEPNPWGEGFTSALLVCRGDERKPLEIVRDDETRTAEQVMAQVLELIRGRPSLLSGDQELRIEFALRRSCLDLPVEQWRLSPRDIPLGHRFRVVVRSLDRFEERIWHPDWERVTRRFRDALVDTPIYRDDALFWVDATEGMNNDQLFGAMKLKTSIIGWAVPHPPADSHEAEIDPFHAGVMAGLVVGLWPRGDTHAKHRWKAILERSLLGGCRLSELPERVAHLRLNASVYADAEGQVGFMWDLFDQLPPALLDQRGLHWPPRRAEEPARPAVIAQPGPPLVEGMAVHD